MKPAQRKSWYLFALWLPLLLPLVVLALAQIGIRWSLVTATFVGSLALAGMHYFIFAIIMLAWGWKKAADDLEKIMWRLPWYFCLFFLVTGLALLSVNAKTYNIGKTIEFTLGLSGFTILVGYFYVVLVHFLTRLFRRIGWIEN